MDVSEVADLWNRWMVTNVGNCEEKTDVQDQVRSAMDIRIPGVFEAVRRGGRG